MDLETARKFLSENGWLSTQPDEFRNELLCRTVLKSYGKGEFIYHLDDAPGMMFGLVDGALLIGAAHPIIGLYQAHLGRPGQWFGEAAALHGVKRRLAIEAPVPVLILYLPISGVQDMLQIQPLWQKNLSSLLLWNTDIAMRTTMDLLIKAPKPRVYARLLTLCGAKVGLTLTATPIDLPLTQSQFATMCGLSRKSVQRILAKMESAGLLENRYGGIRVLNPADLEKRLFALASHDD